MKKQAALLAVNPVNGAGLFHYLESFYENGIFCKIFAVADVVDIKTNCGIDIKADALVGEMMGHESEFDALVFACGDAVPQFADNAHKQYYSDMFAVMRNFALTGRPMAGHCAAALMFDIAGAIDGKHVAVHPFVKGMIKRAVPTDDLSVTDGNIITAQTENTIGLIIPKLIESI